MTTTTNTSYDVYCVAGFYRALHESSIATKAEWSEYIVRQIVETEVIIFNTRENTVAINS